VTPNEQSKRAHLPCRFMTQPVDKCRGQPCKKAGSKEVEIVCQCDHEPCLLTV
jgi:hypothetical protein